MKARLIAITLFFSALFCAAPLYGQISVSLKDVPLTEALSTLENKSSTVSSTATCFRAKTPA